MLKRSLNKLPIVKASVFFLLTFINVHCNSSGTKDNNTVLAKDSVMTGFMEDSNKVSLRSEITCPKCSYKKTETMPTDVCLIKYHCTGCDTTLYPKAGDCCVFCTYGTHKCPSKQ